MFYYQICDTAGKVRDKQSASSAGYLSDGHVSSRSSDNESNSVCSEMVGHAVNTAGKCSLKMLFILVSHKAAVDTRLLLQLSLQN